MPPKKVIKNPSKANKMKEQQKERKEIKEQQKGSYPTKRLVGAGLTEIFNGTTHYENDNIQYNTNGEKIIYI